MGAYEPERARRRAHELDHAARVRPELGALLCQRDCRRERVLQRQRAVLFERDIWRENHSELHDLKRQMQLQEDFVSTISHELRTPLNSVIGFSNVLLKKKNLDEQSLIYLNKIASNGKHLLELINLTEQ